MLYSARYAYVFSRMSEEYSITFLNASVVLTVCQKPLTEKEIAFIGNFSNSFASFIQLVSHSCEKRNDKCMSVMKHLRLFLSGIEKRLGAKEISTLRIINLIFTIKPLNRNRRFDR